MNTTQRLSLTTLARVRSYGKMGETFDQALDKVLDKNKELEDKITELEESEEVHLV